VSEDLEYRERLLPRWWVWLVAFALIIMLAVAYGAALGATAGLVVGGGGLVLVILVLSVTAPRVVLTATELRVADAVLPRTSVASAVRVGPDDIALLRGPGADARLFVSLRPWSSAEGVLVQLLDAVDPHPAWLFSSRHPGRVVDVLTATMGR
jgi:hypothetical protein